MGERRTFRPRPSPQNPKGFYENIRFRNLNDRMLRESGYRVKSWDPRVPAVRPTALTRFRIRTLLSRYRHRYARWGWKDPRTCLTLDVWCHELDRLGLRTQTRLLYIFRDPLAVAASMVQRGNTNHERAVTLWAVYNQRVLDAIAQTPLATSVISYEALCGAPVDTSQRVCAFLDTPHDASVVRNAIDARLDRSSPSAPVRSVTRETLQRAHDVETELRLRESTPARL